MTYLGFFFLPGFPGGLTPSSACDSRSESWQIMKRIIKKAQTRSYVKKRSTSRSRLSVRHSCLGERDYDAGHSNVACLTHTNKQSKMIT